MTLDSSIHTISLKTDIDAPLLSRDDVEARIGARLPNGLLSLLKDGGHATTFEEEVEIKPQQPNPLVGKDGRQGISTIYGLSAGKAGVAATYDRYKDRLGAEYVPIAEDGLGNLFVFQASSPKILFWHHECPQGESSSTAFTVVAEDFSEFISGLCPNVAPEQKATGAKVSGVKSFSFDF